MLHSTLPSWYVNSAYYICALSDENENIQASAISSLHSAGIMHRDLDPRNIQLDREGHILLTSFGSAEFVKEIIEGEQRSSHMSGMRSTSSVFRAPEIILGWTHDRAVDCWSFGMVLYYMVFGTASHCLLQVVGILTSCALDAICKWRRKRE